MNKILKYVHKWENNSNTDIDKYHHRIDNRVGHIDIIPNKATYIIKSNKIKLYMSK